MTRAATFPALMAWCSRLLACISLLGCGDLNDVDPTKAFDLSGPAISVRALTFNILSSFDLTALSAGYPRWGERRHGCLKRIRAADPDILAIEEATPNQLDFLADNLPDYKVLAKSVITTDAALFYRAATFEAVETGHWKFGNLPSLTALVQTRRPMYPELARVAIWAKLRERATRREIFVVATHLDARDTVKASAVKKLKHKLAYFTRIGAPLFVVADLNISTQHDLFQTVLAGGWQDAHTGIGDPPTFPALDPERRIDHILFSGTGVTATRWERIDTPHLVSDHFAVAASFDVAAND